MSIQIADLSIELIQAANWKQKMNYLNQIAHQLKISNLSVSPLHLENIWVDLVRDNNLNVAQKAVETLKTWTQLYITKNTRIIKGVIKALIELAKMGKPEIDQNSIQIVATLFSQEKQSGTSVQRIPLSLIDPERFNSFNQPTFLTGSFEPDTIQEEEQTEKIQEQQQSEESIHTSFILMILSQSMRTCRRRSFAICLKILIELRRRKLLSMGQLTDMLSQIQEIKCVIDHRRLSSETKEAKDQKLSEQIAFLVSELGKC